MMNRITFPLPSDVPGASYSDLHVALQYLLANDLLPMSLAERAAMFPKLKDDRAANSYGDATHSRVTAFQFSAQLRETGEVDELTAEKMSSRLAELGLLSRSMLRCTVTCKQQALAGVTVRLFERDFGPTRSPRVYEAITDQFGQVNIHHSAHALTNWNGCSSEGKSQERIPWKMLMDAETNNKNRSLNSPSTIFPLAISYALEYSPKGIVTLPRDYSNASLRTHSHLQPVSA